MQIIGLRLGLGNNTASRVRGELAFLSQVPPMLRKKIGQEDMRSTCDTERSLYSSTAVRLLVKYTYTFGLSFILPMKN